MIKPSRLHKASVHHGGRKEEGKERPDKWTGAGGGKQKKKTDF